MPTIPPLPQALIPVLPFVALIVTDWLRHSTLPRWINVLIGLAVPLILAAIWALLSNALTPDLGGDIVLLAALCYAVMALPDIAPLRDWLQDTLVSPAALFASQPEPAITARSGPPVPYQSAEAMPLPTVAPRQLPRYRLSDTLQPLKPQPTQPMEAMTPEPPAETEPATPVEESPVQS